MPWPSAFRKPCCYARTSLFNDHHAYLECYMAGYGGSISQAALRKISPLSADLGVRQTSETVRRTSDSGYKGAAN